MSYRPISDTFILCRAKLAKTGAGEAQTYYGAFPAGFLSRAREQLGISILDPLLHVCGGKVRAYPYRGLGPNDMTVDLDPALSPDFLMDVREELPTTPGGWPAVLADPPYTVPDAEHYMGGKGAGVFPEPNALLKRCLQVVRPGGRVGFLHYKWPRPPKHVGGDEVRSVAVFGVLVGFGNAIRCYSVYERVARDPARVFNIKKVSDSVRVLE